MGIFDTIKNIVASGTREISKEYGSNKNFLNAVAASSALVANADGSIDETEKKKAIELITRNETLKSLYTVTDIEQSLVNAFAKSKDASGRQSLARDLESIKGLPNSVQLAEDVYLTAVDISMADGTISPEETAVLQKIAGRLGVDAAKFEF